MKKLLLGFLFLIGLSLSAQAPAFEEMEFEADSSTSAYKSNGKYFAFIKSKKGNNGMPKTSTGDSIKNFQITDIVLVFSELNAGAIEERENANRERWENLLKTYPEFFQFSTLYKNHCQCKINGDSAAFKKAQGFYVYYAAPEPPKKAVVAEPVKEVAKTETKKVEEKKVEKNEKKEVATKTETKAKEEVKETPKKESVAANKKENPKEKEKEEVDNTPDQPEGPEQTTSVDLSANKKKVGFTKPKKTKDPKACAPPCYGTSDEELNLFFKDNITLTKKQRRKSKNLVCQLRLQLNIDGSVKKAFVTGTNPDFNEMVTNALKAMNSWNPAIRNGVTVKSEVKMTLKYDSDFKGIKPFETMINPRPNPKCKCITEGDLVD